MARSDGRAADQLRPVSIVPNFLKYAEGSVLIELGQTRVLCAASVEERVPLFAQGKGIGWVTAEYSLLPRSTHTRTPRESAVGRIGGRTHEIQRLIGRSLRAAVDLTRLGSRTITVDCDVLQADGGTRTAAITGGYVALALALRRLVANGALLEVPVRLPVSAVSAGIVDGERLLDLDYGEDSRASVDFNIVMTGDGRFVEVQGTAEGESFGQDDLQQLLELSAKGIRELLHEQLRVLAGT